jgi:hypothetical protein
MLRTRLTSVGFAVAVSVLAALAVSRQPAAITAPAGEDAPAVVVGAEHALIGDYLRMSARERLAADREADAELARSRAQAAVDAKARYADAIVPVMFAPRRKTVHVMAEAAVPAAAPLQLQAPQALPAPQPVQTADLAGKRPVIARVVATVVELPRLVRSGVEDAAAWVTELPAQALPKLSERRFL